MINDFISIGSNLTSKEIILTLKIKWDWKSINTESNFKANTHFTVVFYSIQNSNNDIKTTKERGTHVQL